MNCAPSPPDTPGTRRWSGTSPSPSARASPSACSAQSGCGKSTLARVAALLHRPDSGTLLLDGEPVRQWRHRAPRALHTAFGVVFQQARLSADPRLPLSDLIAEPLRATGRGGEVPGLVAELAPAVGLTPDLLTRRPHEVSDGRLQRACLAPALVLRPACWCAAR